MNLTNILIKYKDQFLASHGDRLSKEQRYALDALTGCRSGLFGEIHLHCTNCRTNTTAMQSCGHRNCNQCHHHDTVKWLKRQQQKLLPVDYYLITFTLPSELRPIAFRHQSTVYNLLFEAVTSTLRSFFESDKHWQGQPGFTSVLHTHSRRLEHHPHIHVVVPAGSWNPKTRQWTSRTGKYLFNHKNLATVFRAIFLKSLDQCGLKPNINYPKEWMVDVTHAGNGYPALTYLSKYLYRGVIADKNIVSDNNGLITFKYQDSKTKETRKRTLSVEDFIWKLLIHVLPKRFRRARDYGFLHGKLATLLFLIKQTIRAKPTRPASKPRPSFQCSICRCPLQIIGFSRRGQSIESG
jgi:hypothetical protein